MRIAVLGAGNIGATMGKKWAAAGHDVAFGVRDPGADKVATVLQAAGANARADSVAAALAEAEAVLVAVPYDAVPGIAEAHAGALAGKIVIDASNRFGAAVVNNLAVLERVVPDAVLFRAFNSLGWEVFDRPDFGSGPVDHFYAGPDGPERSAVEGLIADVGVRPVWVGDLDAAPVVDAVGSLWVALAFRRGWGRDIALKLVARAD